MVSPQQQFTSRMGGALASLGMPPLASRVFAALLIDDDGRMTSAELTAALEVSAAGVSGAVNYLAQLGMVRREREPGSRRDVYVVDDDAWHATMMRSDQFYAPLLQSLDHAIGALGPDAPARHRMVLTQQFLRFVTEEMHEMLARWDLRKAEIEDRLTRS